MRRVRSLSREARFASDAKAIMDILIARWLEQRMRNPVLAADLLNQRVAAGYDVLDASHDNEIARKEVLDAMRRTVELDERAEIGCLGSYRLLELAEGQTRSEQEEAHLAACPECSSVLAIWTRAQEKLSTN